MNRHASPTRRSLLHLAGAAALLAAVGPARTRAQACPDRFALLFSVDIGSDCEISDPAMDGDEGFDPGDLYRARSSSVFPGTFILGRDGADDDGSIFGSDPDPDPPYTSVTSTRVPVPSSCDPDVHGCYAEYFDLDGADRIAYDLRQYIDPDDDNPQPVPQDAFPVSNCIFDVRHLAVSFDDDGAGGWPAGDVPVGASSPAGRRYGRRSARDEAKGLRLLPTGGAPPFHVAGSGAGYRFVNERQIHDDLAPNPNASEPDDDDVDSLDLVEASDGKPAGCEILLFSADAEAHLGLDPGHIYQRTTTGPTKVIDARLHLGLPDDVDVDAFEMAWIGPQGSLVVGILFSVDDDDPLTAADESGAAAHPALDPNMIYYSALNGQYHELLDALPADDVDALALWCRRLTPQLTHDDEVSVEDTAHGGYIDPRMESSDGVHPDLGLREVILRFDQPMDFAALAVEDITIRQTGSEAPPEVEETVSWDAEYLMIRMSRPPTLKEWTTIEVRAQSLSGIEIDSEGDLGPGEDEPDRIDLAGLPCDIDNSGQITPLDMLRFRQGVHGQWEPDRGVLLDYIDLDRSGQTTPFDLLRFRQLLHGVSPATQAWSGQEMNSPQP